MSNWRDLFLTPEETPKLPQPDPHLVVFGGGVASAPPDDGTTAALLTKVLARDSPYGSFVRVYEGMAFLPDPAMRFQAAVAAVKAHGASVTDILQAIGLHEADLVAQEHAFEATLKAQTEQQVMEKQRHAVEVGKALEGLRQQLASLQQQIEEKEREQAASVREGDEARARIDQVAQGFKTAVDAVGLRLREDKARLTR